MGERTCTVPSNRAPCHGPSSSACKNFRCDCLTLGMLLLIAQQELANIIQAIPIAMGVL